MFESMENDLKDRITAIKTRIGRIGVDIEILNNEKKVLDDQLWELEKIIDRSEEGVYERINKIRDAPKKPIDPKMVEKYCANP